MCVHLVSLVLVLAAGWLALCRILCKSECVCTWRLFCWLWLCIGLPCAAFCVKANVCALGDSSVGSGCVLVCPVPHSV